MVRERRALRPPAARAVRLFAAHAQPAHQPREPAPARPGLRRAVRGLDRADARACTARPAAAGPADVHALHAARRDAEEPRGGLADGAVLLRGRRAGRLPPGPPGRARHGRRRHGGGGDDLPSPDARITPGCPGLWNEQQRDGWKRIVDFVHAQTDAKIAMQLGHAGAKGSTRVPWEGEDLPLESGNWPLLSASPQQYLDGVSDWSRAMTRADMDRVRDDFVRARALWAAEAGLRLAGAALRPRLPAVQLHLAADQPAHRRIRRLAGEPAALSAGSVPCDARGVAAGPADVGAHLGARLGRGRHHARRRGGDRARQFKAAGADLIDCSSGQVSKKQQPVYGRMYQTPFADRIRNEAGIATMAVGAISEADHVNSIIAAGRADLCAVARPHLANPGLDPDRSGQDRLPRPRVAEAVPVRQDPARTQPGARERVQAHLWRPRGKMNASTDASIPRWPRATASSSPATARALPVGREGRRGDRHAEPARAQEPADLRVVRRAARPVRRAAVRDRRARGGGGRRGRQLLLRRRRARDHRPAGAA